jgi:glutathione S-transferase
MKAPKAFADSTDMANARDPDHARAMYLFNCKQRAHLNYMELLPATAMSLLIAGFRYPHTSTALGVGWCFGRILYALGYTNLRKEDASGRILGFVLSQPLAFALWGLAGWTGLRLVM